MWPPILVFQSKLIRSCSDGNFASGETWLGSFISLLRDYLNKLWIDYWETRSCLLTKSNRWLISFFIVLWSFYNTSKLASEFLDFIIFGVYCSPTVSPITLLIPLSLLYLDDDANSVLNLVFLKPALEFCEFLPVLTSSTWFLIMRITFGGTILFLMYRWFCIYLCCVLRAYNWLMKCTYLFQSLVCLLTSIVSFERNGSYGLVW